MLLVARSLVPALPAVFAVILAGCAAAEPPAADATQVVAAADRPGGDTPTEAASPDGAAAEFIAGVRDPEHDEPRSAMLLVDTASQLERRLESTPRDEDDRVFVMRDLAQTYAALARTHDPKVRVDARATRGKAIELLEPLVQAGAMRAAALRALGATDLETVKYELALEYERAGRMSDARKAYLDLAAHSGSRYAPLAYLAIGDGFLREAKSDPSELPLADAAYAKARTASVEGDAVHAAALLRAAEAAEAAGDQASARDRYREATRELPPDVALAAVPAWARQ